MTPHELAAWAERAGPDEQRAVLEALRDLRWKHTCRNPVWDCGDDWQRIDAMLDCGAFESAVISLVPEGWGYRVQQPANQSGDCLPAAHLWQQGRSADGAAQTPSLALAAAVARTMEG